MAKEAGMRREDQGRLTLTRKVGESIQVGDDVVVELASVADGKARIAITAPRSVTVLRSELMESRNG